MTTEEKIRNVAMKNHERFGYRFWSPRTQSWCQECGEQLYVNTLLSLAGLIATQCVGLKDTNGKLIFEHDIIEIKNLQDVPSVSFIYWDKEFAQFYFVNRDQDYYWETNGLYNPWKEITIIGNIYENPELIEDYDLRSLIHECLR